MSIRRAARARRRTTSIVLAVCFVMTSLSVAFVADAGFAAPTVTVTASADTYVSSSDPGQNFGGAPAVRVDASPVLRGYTKFQVAGLTAPVVAAELRLYSRTASRGVVVSTTTTGWNEATMTMAGSPGPLAIVGAAPPTARRTTATVDVTGAIDGNGTYAFVLTSASDTQQGWGTKESGHAARLVLTTAAPVSTSSSTTTTSSSTTTTSTTSSTTSTTTTTTTLPPPPVSDPPVAGSTSLPIRAAFYYPWFPEAWKQSGISPYTWFHPSAGLYDGSNSATLSRQIADMRYAGLNAGIASWWGQGSRTDGRVASLLRAAAPTDFHWSLYYEAEGSSDPTVAQIDDDLTYLASNYASDPHFLHISGRPVIFVYGDGGDGCSTADRWAEANRSRFYVVLKVFSGYRQCASQPDNWHQYAPAKRADSQVGYSYSVSPGFSLRSESTERLPRDPAAFAAAVQAMVASNAPLQLVTTFNEWGEGTAVESAQEWGTLTGEGTYLDILHQYLAGAPLAAADPVIATAGDIACDPTDGNFKAGSGSSSACHMKATSDLLGTIPNLAAVLPLGDNQYEQGQLAGYNASYGPSWGRFIDKTRPIPGNHEYQTPGGVGYYQYFGARAGDPTKGYYSYDVGNWHVVALNSNCTDVGGCGKTSPQVAWLTLDLAAHPAACTLAYWHHPRFSSGGEHGNNASIDPLWRTLAAGGVEIVLNGHEHDYERFDPQTPDAVASPTGIREFVVGTGGKSHYALGTTVANSAVRNDDTFGLLQLTLHPTSYDWQFLPEPGKTFTDSGTTACH